MGYGWRMNGFPACDKRANPDGNPLKISFTFLYPECTRLSLFLRCGTPVKAAFPFDPIRKRLDP